MSQTKIITIKFLFILIAIFTLSGCGETETERLQDRCEAREGSECFNLAQMYEKGEAAEKDLKKAIEFYKKACDLEVGLGCNNLGEMYEKGEGAEKDLKKATKFYKKACDLKVANGCNNLGEIYQYGVGG